jgi:hypothetical protein
MNFLATILPEGIALTAKVSPIDLPPDLSLRMSQIEEIVGGSIKALSLTGGQALVIRQTHEPGAQPVINELATMAARASQAIHPSDVIVGNAVIVPSAAL